MGKVYSITGVGRAPDGSEGAFTGTLEVGDAPPPPPPPAPTAEISVSPEAVEVGQEFTLSWATAGAATATIGGLPVGLSGSTPLVATAAGVFAYTITAIGPGGTATATTSVTVAEPPPPGPALPLRFDFGTVISPTAVGWLGVIPSTDWSEVRGYGWLDTSAVSAYDRGVVAPDLHTRWPGDDLTRDFCAGRDISFRCRVPAGTHPVRLVIGDMKIATIDCDIYVNGEFRDTHNSGPGYQIERHYQASCPDGLLTVRLVGRGSDAPLCALEVGGTYVPPDVPKATHLLDFGTPTSPLQPGYERVTHLDHYNSQRCRGFESTWSMPFSRERTGGATPLLRDFVQNRDMTYRVDVPPGRYAVRPTCYDQASGHDWNTYVQGVQQGGLVTLSAGQLYEPEFLVDAPDGVIRLRLQGYREGGGPDENAVLNALVVEPAGVVPPTAEISVSPEAVEVGQQFTLSWATAGAAEADIDRDIVELSGSLTMTASAAGTRTYVLTAVGPGGTATDSVTLTVTEAPPPPPAPTATLAVDPASVVRGASATLMWSTTNAATALVFADGGAEWAVPVSGTLAVSPNVTTAYRLSANGPGGTAVSDPVTLTVTSLPDPPPGPPPTIEINHGGLLPVEHIPDYGYDPTHVAVRSGMWGDPAVWGAAGVPGEGSRVAIPGVEIIHCPGCGDPRAAVVSPRAGGTLTLLEGAQLSCGTLLSLGGSTVRGSGAVTLILGGATAWPEWDPKQYGQGLVILGHIDLRGSSRGKVWGWTGAGRGAGQTTIPLPDAAAAGWRPGDTVVIPDTRKSVKPADRHEFRQVASVGTNSITLTLPLQFAHPGSGALPYGVPVANLTRDFVVRSAASGLRGHVMFTGHAKAWLEGVEFRDLGRTTVAPLAAGTNQVGRYSVHAHCLHTHDELPPMHLEGCVIRDTDPAGTVRWGVTVHATDGCRVANNAVWNKTGWGYGTESGHEYGNVFEGNFAGCVTGYQNNYADPASRGWSNDVGFSGDGFWFRTAGQVCRGNVAVDCLVGFGIYANGQPNPKKINGTMQNPKNVQIIDFSENCALGGRMNNGYTFWELGMFATFYPNADAPEQFVRDCAAWNVHQAGYLGYPCNHLRLVNFRVNNSKQGIYCQHYTTCDFQVLGGQISNCLDGVYTGNQNGSPPTAEQYRNITFVNNAQSDIRVPVKDVASTEATRTPRHITIDGCVHSNAPKSIWMDPTLVGNSIDLTLPLVVDVKNFQGVQGDDFRLYFHEQRGDYVMPAANAPQGQIKYGNPQSGATNDQLLAQGLPVYAGSVAPADAVTRPKVVGLVKAVTP